MYLLIICLPLFSFFSAAFLSFLFGKRGICFISTFFLGLSMLISLFIFYEVILCNSTCNVFFSNWFNVGLFSVSWSFYFDGLTAIMCVMITIVSFAVHMFSISYMERDFQQERFMGLLSIFTFFMLVLVTADNFLQLILGWEGVGICSYLLINFWFMRKNTNDSALKALIFNRVGDLFLLLAMFLVYFYLKTFDFVIVFDSFRVLEFVKFNFLFYDFNLLDIISCFLVIAAVAKSAQIFLSGWLMDAMEGPTPVSALIHAATMVTAGIYLVVRFSTLITNSPTAIFLIVLSGSLTTLLCSLIGIDSFDLKRIIASSTASQLGYMFFVCGLTEYASAICHLFYHAFFKALLFLSAGVIIHSLADEQDIRKMGGLVQKMPLAFIAVSLGSFALIGAPFIGGFYSKDPIIEYSDLLLFTENLLTFFCCTLGAFNTTYYSTRLVSLVFLGRYNGPKMVFSRLHDSSLFMYIPLIFLLFFTCFVFLSTDIFLGEANLFWFFEEEDLFFFREGEEDVDTFILTIFFILLGAFGFKNESVFDLNLSNFQNSVTGYQSDDFFKFVKNCNFFKWYFDFFFIKFFVNFFYKFSNFLFLNFDRGVFEIFGPLTFVRFFGYISFLVTRLQTGFIYHYVLFQIINLIFILIYLNDFILESKSFLFVFLIFFGFFRFFVKFDFFPLGLNMVARGIHRFGSNGNNENLFRTNKRMYSTSNNDNKSSVKDEMFRSESKSNNNSKQKFDNKNLSNTTDKIKEIGKWGLDAFFSVFFFFFVQFYEVIKFVILVLLRVFIAFPLLVGKFVLEYFFYRPIKFFFTFFFKLVLSIFKFKFFIIGLVIYFFSAFQRNQNIPKIGAKFVDLSLAPEDLIFVNRAASPVIERVFYINKKFPQLHEIESSFFNLHSPLTFRMQRFFNFFHPLDFRFWFWNLGAGDSDFSFYMPEIWNRDKLETSNFASYFLIKQKFKIHPGKREKHFANQTILDQDNILLNTSHNFSKSWLGGIVQKYNYVYRGGLGFDLNETIFQNNTVEEREQPTGKELHEDFVVKKSFNIHHMYKTALQKQKGASKVASSSEKKKGVNFLESDIPGRIIFSLHEVIKVKDEQRQTDLDLSLLQEKKETFNQLKPIDPAELEGRRFFVDPNYFIYLDEYNVVRKFQFVSSKNVNKLLNYYSFVKPDVDSLPFEAHTVELLEDYDRSLNLDLDIDLGTAESSMSVEMPFSQAYVSHGLVRGFFNFLSKSFDKNSVIDFNSRLVSSFDSMGDIFSGYVNLFKNFHLIFSTYGLNSLSFYSFPVFSFDSDSIMSLKSLSVSELFGKKQFLHNSTELASMKREKFFLLNTIDKRRLELISLTKGVNSTSFSTTEKRRVFDLKQSFIADFGFPFDDYSSYLEYKRLAFSKTSDIFFSNFESHLFSRHERALYDEINVRLKAFFTKYENSFEKNRDSEFVANRSELLLLLKKYETLYGSTFLDNINNIKRFHILLKQFLQGDVDVKGPLVESFFLEMEGFLKRAGFFSNSDLVLINNTYNKNVAEHCLIMNNRRLELFFNSNLVTNSSESDFIQEYGFAFDDIWMAKRIRKDLLLVNIEKELQPEAEGLYGIEISPEMASNFKNLREKLYDAILGDEQAWEQTAAGVSSFKKLKHIDRAIIRKKIEDYNSLTGSYYAPAGPNNIIVFEDPDLQEVVHFMRNELDGLLRSYWAKYQKGFFDDQDIETDDPFELKKPKLAVEFFDKYKTITEGFEFETSKAIAHGDSARLQDLDYFFDLFRNRYSPIFDLERQVINSNKLDVSLVSFSKASEFDSSKAMSNIDVADMSALSSKDLGRIYHFANISWLDFFPKLARAIKLASLIGLNERNFDGSNSDEGLLGGQKFHRKVSISLKEEFFKNCGFHYDVNNLHNLSDYFYDQTNGLFGYISFNSFMDFEKIALRPLTYLEFENWVFHLFLSDSNFRVFLCTFEEPAFGDFVEKELIGKLLDYLEYSMSIGAIESVIDVSKCIRLYETLFGPSNNSFEMNLSNITNLASGLVESNNFNVEFIEPVKDVTKKKLLRLYGLVEDNAFSDISNDLRENSDVEFLNFYKFLFDHLYKLSEFSTMRAPWLLETSATLEHSELTKPVLFSEFQTRCVDMILSMFSSMTVDSTFVDKFNKQLTLYDKLILLRDFLTNEEFSGDSRGDLIDIVEGFLHYFEFNFPGVYYFQRDLNNLLNYQSKFSFFYNIPAFDYFQSASNMSTKLNNDFSLAKKSFSNLYGFEFEDELKVLESNSADLNKRALFDLEFVGKEVSNNLNLKSFFEGHNFGTLGSLDSLIVEWNVHSDHVFNTAKEFFKDYYQLLFGNPYSSEQISSSGVNFGLDEELSKLFEFFSTTDSKKKEELVGSTKQLIFRVKEESFTNFIRLYEKCFLTLINGATTFSYQQFIADCNSIRLFDEYFVEFKKFIFPWFPELSNTILSIMESSLSGVKYFFALKYGFAFDDIDKVLKYKNSFEEESFSGNYDIYNQDLAYNLINQFKSSYFQRYGVKYPEIPASDLQFSGSCVMGREFINRLVQLYNQRYNFLDIKKEFGVENYQEKFFSLEDFEKMNWVAGREGQIVPDFLKEITDTLKVIGRGKNNFSVSDTAFLKKIDSYLTNLRVSSSDSNALVNDNENLITIEKIFAEIRLILSNSKIDISVEPMESFLLNYSQLADSFKVLAAKRRLFLSDLETLMARLKIGVSENNSREINFVLEEVRKLFNDVNLNLRSEDLNKLFSPSNRDLLEKKESILRLLEQVKILPFVDVKLINELANFLVGLQFDFVQGQEMTRILNGLEVELTRLVSKLGFHSERFVKCNKLIDSLKIFVLNKKNAQLITKTQEIEAKLLNDLKFGILTDDAAKLLEFDKNLELLNNTMETVNSLVPVNDVFGSFPKDLLIFIDKFSDLPTVETRLKKMFKYPLDFMTNIYSDGLIHPRFRNEFKSKLDDFKGLLNKNESNYLLLNLDKIIKSLENLYDFFVRIFPKGYEDLYQEQVYRFDFIKVERKIFQIVQANSLLIKSILRGLVRFNNKDKEKLQALLSDKYRKLSFITDNPNFTRFDKIRIEVEFSQFLFYYDDKVAFAKIFGKDWEDLCVLKDSKDPSDQRIFSQKLDVFFENFIRWRAGVKKRAPGDSVDYIIPEFKRALGFLQALSYLSTDPNSQLSKELEEIRSKFRSLNLSFFLRNDGRFEDSVDFLRNVHHYFKEQVQTGKIKLGKGKEPVSVLNNLDSIESKLLSLVQDESSKISEKSKKSLIADRQKCLKLYEDLLHKVVNFDSVVSTHTSEPEFFALCTRLRVMHFEVSFDLLKQFFDFASGFELYPEEDSFVLDNFNRILSSTSEFVVDSYEPFADLLNLKVELEQLSLSSREESIALIDKFFLDVKMIFGSSLNDLTGERISSCMEALKLLIEESKNAVFLKNWKLALGLFLNIDKELKNLELLFCGLEPLSQKLNKLNESLRSFIKINNNFLEREDNINVVQSLLDELKSSSALLSAKDLKVILAKIENEAKRLKSLSINENLNKKLDLFLQKLALLHFKEEKNLSLGLIDEFLSSFNTIVNSLGSYYPADKRLLFLSNIQMLEANLRTAFIKNDFREIGALLERIRAIFEIEKWKLFGGSNLSQVELEKLYFALEKTFNFVFINENLIRKKDHILALLKQMKNLSFVESEFRNELTFLFLNMQFASVKDQEVMEILDKLETELQRLLSNKTLRSFAIENENLVAELERGLFDFKNTLNSRFNSDAFIIGFETNSELLKKIDSLSKLLEDLDFSFSIKEIMEKKDLVIKLLQNIVADSSIFFDDPKVLWKIDEVIAYLTNLNNFFIGSNMQIGPKLTEVESFLIKMLDSRSLPLFVEKFGQIRSLFDELNSHITSIENKDAFLLKNLINQCEKSLLSRLRNFFFFGNGTIQKLNEELQSLNKIVADLKFSVKSNNTGNLVYKLYTEIDTELRLYNFFFGDWHNPNANSSMLGLERSFRAKIVNLIDQLSILGRKAPENYHQFFSTSAENNALVSLFSRVRRDRYFIKGLIDYKNQGYNFGSLYSSGVLISDLDSLGGFYLSSLSEFSDILSLSSSFEDIDFGLSQARTKLFSFDAKEIPIDFFYYFIFSLERNLLLPDIERLYSIYDASNSSFNRALDFSNKDTRDFFEFITGETISLSYLDSVDPHSILSDVEIEKVKFFDLFLKSWAIDNIGDNGNNQDLEGNLIFRRYVDSFLKLFSHKFPEIVNQDQFSIFIKNYDSALFNYIRQELLLLPLILKEYSDVDSVSLELDFHLLPFDKKVEFINQFFSKIERVLLENYNRDSGQNDNRYNIGLNLIPGNYNMFRFDPSRTITRGSLLPLQNEEFVFTDFDAPENMIANYGSTYLKSFGSKLQTLGVRKQDYFSLRPQFFYSRYIDDFFLEKSFRITRRMHFHPETQSQLVVNPEFLGQFHLLALSSIGEQLETYIILAPVYNILNEFLSNLVKVKNSALISGVDPRLVESALIFLFSYVNQCKLIANQSLESGLSQGEILHNLSLQLYKLRVKSLKDYLISEFGHIVDLNLIFRFADNLFVGLLKPNVSDYLVRGLKAQTVIPSFDLFYGVLNVSERLRSTKIQNFLHEIDFDTSYIKFGTLFDDFFDLGEEQFAAPTTLIEFDIDSEPLSQDREVDFLELGLSTSSDSDLTDLDFASSGDIDITVDLDLDNASSLELVDSLISKFLVISRTLRNGVFTDVDYSVDRVYHLKFLLSLASRLEGFLISDFSESETLLNDLLVEKKNLLSYLSFEESKPLMKDKQGLSLEFPNAIADFIYSRDVEIATVLGPQISSQNLYSGDFVDTSLLEKVPKEEEKFSTDKFNAFFNNPVEFASDRISAMVINNNNLNNLFPGADKGYTFYNLRDYFSNSTDKVLRFLTPVANLRRFVTRPIKIYLRPFSNFNMANFGLVHNPLLWFGHFSESYKSFDDQFHAFQVYKERFNFFSMVVTKNFGSPLFNSVGDRSQGWKTSRKSSDLSGYGQLLSQLQSSSIVGKRRDLTFRESTVKQASQVSKLVGSLPFNYHNTKWILIPDSFSSTLKWFHRDGFRNILPSPLLRLTASDFWVNRRRYARYYFDEFGFFELLKKDPLISFLLKFETVCHNFFFSYGLSDFFFVELKYSILDFFFVDSFLSRFINLFVPDMLSEFVSLYKFLCLKLLLALSDRWLWLLIGVFKVFLLTSFNFFFDDLFGFFMLYKGNVDVVHSYISLDPGLLRYERKFRKRPPNPARFLLPLNFVSVKGRREVLNSFVFRYGVENWDFYADSIERHKSNVLHKFYGKRRSAGYKILGHIRPFRDAKWPELGLVEARRKQLEKRKLLDVGRVFQNPFEFSSKKYGFAFSSFENIVSFQKYTVKPVSVIMQTQDFGNRRSLRRIKQWKYFKPIYLLYNKTNYSFVFQNELLRKSFFPSRSNGISYSNPYLPSSNYRKSSGFNRPHFGETNRIDLLVDHYFSSSFNYPGMPKIEFNREFSIDLSALNNKCSKLPKKSYSVFRHAKPNLSFFPNRLVYHFDLWRTNFKDDPFRKTMFYFFAWQWTTGYFREFFIAPFHNNFFMFLGGFYQRYNTPLEEYTSPYWLNFVKLASNGKFSFGSTKSFAYISNSFGTYDRSTIFERFAYDPNFSGQNPYVLNPFKRLSTVSGLYDFVDKPGVRQSALYGKAESFPHRNIFRTTGGVVQLGTPAYKKFHFVKKALYHDVSENKVVGDQKPYDYLDSKIQLPNFTRRRRRRTVFLTISLFFKFILKIYLVSIDVFFAYYQFWVYCYKQILFLIFFFFLLRFYLYVFKLIIFEYKVRLLIFKNFLISEKLLYLNEINLGQDAHTFAAFSMPDIPYFVRLSPAFIRYRRFLFLHFIINLPKNLVVRSFYEFFRLVKMVIKDFHLDNVGSFFVLFRDVMKLMVNFVFRYFNYYYSILAVLFLRSLKLMFFYYIRILRFYFDRSLPFAFYSYYFSLFFSYSFFLSFLRYLFRVFIFVLVRILIVFLRILRLLFVFLILFFIVGFYSASTGRYISEFSPQLTQWIFIFFLIWIFSSFSKVWSENFLSSGFPEFQPFLEDSGSLEEVYPITEPEFFLPEEDDEDDAQEYEIADVESYDPRFIAFFEARNGIQELDDFPLLPSIDEDVLELLEYEGASLDFSDGDYFNFENEELSRWYSYHSNFFNNLSSLFLAMTEQKKNLLLKSNFLKTFYNEDERSVESYKRDPRMFVPFFSYRYSVSVQRFYFYVDALHSLTSLFKRNVFYSNKVRVDQEFLEVYKTYIFPFYRYYGRIFNPYNKDSDQFKSEYEFFFNLDFMSYSKTIDSFSLFSEYVFDEEDEDLWFWEDSDDYHTDPDEDYFEEESDDELEFFVELDDLEEEEDDPEEDGIDFIIPCESLNYSGFISGFSSHTYAGCLFDAVSPVHISSVFVAESFDDNLLIRDSGWISELLVDRFLIDTSSSYDNSFEGDFLLLSKISQYTDTFVDSNFLIAKSAEFRNFVLAFLKSIACSKIGFMTVKLKRNVGMFSVRSREFLSSKDYLDYSEEPDAFIAGPSFYEFDFNSQFFESLNSKRAFFIFYHPYRNNAIGNSLKVVPLLGYEAFNNIYKRRFFKDPLFYINLLSLKNYPDLTLEEAQRLWLYLGCTKDEWDSIDNSFDTKFTSQPFFDSMEFPFLFSLLIFCYSLRVWFRYSILDYRYYSSNEYLFERLFNSWFLDPRQFQKGLDFVYTKQTFNEYYLSSYNYVLFYRSFKSFLCFFHEWVVMFWSFFSHFFFFFMNSESFSVNDIHWDVLLPAIGIDSALIDRPVFKYFCLFLSYLVFSFFFKWKGIFDVFSVFLKTVCAQLFVLFHSLSEYFFLVFYFFFNIDLLFYSWPFFLPFNYCFGFFCIESFLELFKSFLFFFYSDHVYFYAILPLCFLVIFQALGFFTFLSSSFSFILKFFIAFVFFFLQLFIFFDVLFFLLFFEVIIKFGYFGSLFSIDSSVCVFFTVLYLFIFLFYKKLKK